MTTSPQAIKKLAKFLEYALGRRPDEFGLLLDPEGFVKIKTLLQALHEDPEWRHVRQGQLNALMIMERPAPIEIRDNLVRARSREHLPVITRPTQLPKLLYTSIRLRAYPTVSDKGIHPAGLPYILLSTDISTARHLGLRTDNAPVVLTVQAAMAQDGGTLFQRYGELLYLADFIPKGCFSGPPLPKERIVASTPKEATAPAHPKTPGSYFPDMSSPDKQGAAPHQRPKRDERAWKKERRRARKEKDRRWQ